MSKRKSSDTVEKLQESVSDVIPEGEKPQRKRVVNDESRTSEQARWSKNEDQDIALSSFNQSFEAKLSDMHDLDSNLLSNSGLDCEDRCDGFESISAIVFGTKQPSYSFQNLSILEVPQQNTERKSRDKVGF